MPVVAEAMFVLGRVINNIDAGDPQILDHRYMIICQSASVGLDEVVAIS